MSGTFEGGAWADSEGVVTVTTGAGDVFSVPAADFDSAAFRDLTAQQADAAAADAALAATTTTRAALTDALNLAALYPAPSPEENAIIDAQVATALAGFRDLSSPPADVVALAAAVVSWRATT